MSDVVIGIDLGTTNSCAAAVINGQPTVIPNAQGYRTTPSIYAIGSGGQQLVGNLAKRQQLTNPDNTVYAAKRLIGRRYDAAEVQRACQLYPYAIVPGPHGDVRVDVGGKNFAISEISAKILSEIKSYCEAYLSQKVEQCVITVPAFFNDSQRQATKDAGVIAGLDVLRIINEPTAAAIAYGIGKVADQKILIYDLGGGTFDVSVLQLNRNVFEVIATTGDTFLGGEDIDIRLLEELLTDFHAGTGVQLSGDRLALQRLKTAAEEAKIQLSFESEAVVNLPFIAVDKENNPVHFEATVTREQLEDWSRNLIARTMNVTEQALEMAGVDKPEMEAVVLVGGQTRMPYIQKRLEEMFGKPPRKGINPDEVVAIGAAIHGASLTKQTRPEDDVLLMDVTPLSLGIATQGGFFAKLIERNTAVPCKRGHVFTTVRDNQDKVKIQVFQGEGEKVRENELLGEFILTGIPPAPRGGPKIEVMFSINAEGLVSVAAKDMDTGKTQKIDVTATSGLTEEEIKQMAKQHEESMELDFFEDVEDV